MFGNFNMIIVYLFALFGLFCVIVLFAVKWTIEDRKKEIDALLRRLFKTMKSRVKCDILNGVDPTERLDEMERLVDLYPTMIEKFWIPLDKFYNKDKFK